MRGILAFLAVCAASAACYILGHRQGQRVPLLGGHRCPACNAPVDLGTVDPNRRTGPRAGQSFYRPGA